MNTIIMKFGGASVSTPAHFARIAEIILKRKKKYDRIVVVVSAMGNTTDELLHLAHKVNPDPPQREVDMLISVGERISISLLAMALAAKEQKAVSFTGSQSGIITNVDHNKARIVDVRPYRIAPHLDEGDVVIVAGFQGVSQDREITTLGRGGSDTTAVALGLALSADAVEFYKDVTGVYDKDPNVHSDAKHHGELDFAAALEVVKSGSEVLSERCLLLAQKNGLPLHVLSYRELSSHGTWIRDPQSAGRVVEPIYETEGALENSLLFS